MVKPINTPPTFNEQIPQLSIGVPVFNEEAYIEETLRSLQAQDYSNIEIIVSDNGSTDTTLNICKGIAKNDARIKIYDYKANRGALWNFQNLLSLAKGEFFMWAGAHDRWLPSFGSSCILALQESPDNVTAYPAGEFVDQNGHSLGAISTAYDTRGVHNRIRPWVTAWLLQSHYAYPIYGVHRTEVISKVSLTNKCIGPDVVALFELAFLGCTVYVSGQPKIEIRQTNDYGDWSAYLERIYGSTEITTKQALRDMRSAYWKVIKKRVHTLKGKWFHLFCLFTFMPVLRNWSKKATNDFP
ncbi:glycosyltransferase family 2 protein [Pseudomonadota bacterium]